MSDLDDIMRLVDSQSKHMHHLRTSFNRAYADKPDLQYQDTLPSAECRAFAIMCVQAYIRSKNEAIRSSR